jgi:dTDP-4-amino-4,6-dideoxygalactose transaminase
VRVPFVELALDNESVGAELRDAFDRVLANSSFTGGVEVEQFEEALAQRVGTQHAVGVASGTAALHLALAAAGIGPGSEVIVPANTFFATAEAVVATGATPVLADVDPSTALLDPVSAAAAVTPRTEALVPVHLYGQTADADACRALAARHHLFLLEDAAQAIGGSWAGEPAGSLGNAGAFSFYPAKNLGALGDGGAVTTNDGELADRVRLLRSHGEQRKHHHVVSGWCARLDGLQAAFLSVKLRHLDQWQRKRDRAAAHYRSHLVNVPGVKQLVVCPRARHVHHLFVVRVPQRDAVLECLRTADVHAAVHYPTPIHLQPAFRDLGLRGDFPHAEALAASIISLPLFPAISRHQLDRCIEALTDAVENVA